MRELVAALAISAPFLVGASVADGRDGDVVARFQDPRIVESSGLVVAGRMAATVNDSGHDQVVYTVDLGTGRTVGTTSWPGAGTDLEALAPAGPGELWAGDIGDNLHLRDDIVVTRLPYGSGDRQAAAESYRLTYPDRATDAEALLAHPRTGRLYVATKDVFGGGIYAAPARLDQTAANRMTRIGDAPSVVTDGAFFPDGRHLLLRNYGAATVLAFPSLEKVGSFPLPSQQQGEGVAISPDARIYLSSEGSRAPLLEVALPEEISEKMGTATTTEEPDPGQAPDQPVENEPAEDDATEFEREAWPWLAGGLLGLIAIIVLVRSLRPR